MLYENYKSGQVIYCGFPYAYQINENDEKAKECFYNSPVDNTLPHHSGSYWYGDIKDREQYDMTSGFHFINYVHGAQGVCEDENTAILAALGVPPTYNGLSLFPRGKHLPELSATALHFNGWQNRIYMQGQHVCNIVEYTNSENVSYKVAYDMFATQGSVETFQSHPTLGEAVEEYVNMWVEKYSDVFEDFWYKLIE